jgi:hypothetical protein
LILKKLVSILLLSLLSFNWFGFQLLISFLENRANTLLDARLDHDDYQEDELISIKVPATNLAYYTNGKLFARVDGQIEMQGVLYNFVKRRLYHDSLELLCIPNTVVMKLLTEKNELVKCINDIQQPEQGKKSTNHPGSNKNLSLDHYTLQHLFELNNLSAHGPGISFYISPLCSFSYCESIENPPKHTIPFSPAKI